MLSRYMLIIGRDAVEDHRGSESGQGGQGLC